jgi:3-keto-5-aminohexanoate cleavage enzyme
MNELAIMVAPNGARKGPTDHENLPITADALAREAALCHAAGAQAIHMHVRDEAGSHVLDANRYIEATAAVRAKVGSDFVIQITTEAVGRFSPVEQANVLRQVCPEAVSIAVAELIPDPTAESHAADLYSWAREEGIAVQHIIYSAGELEWFLSLVERGVIAGERYSLMFPLGRYAANQESHPAEVIPLLGRLRESAIAQQAEWWVCAFGRAETPALVAAAALGGHCRVGFENSFFNSDGSRASGNAERVRELTEAIHHIRRRPAGRDDVLRALGKP